jgi:TonB family protein
MVAEGYQLKSDLARLCLPRPEGHPQRTLAWLNSICLLFLIVAWSGVRIRLPMPTAVPPLDQPVPIIIQPLPPPPTTQVAQPKEETTEEKTAAPRIVVVTPDSPAINFFVPTIGNVIVPNAFAAPPPTVALQQTTAVVHNEPKRISSTGEGGDRPRPPYPEMALKFGQQGTVILLLTVSESGLVQSVSVKETSGSPILDRSALEFVKRHWIVPPGNGGRLFEASISYEIKNN